MKTKTLIGITLVFGIVALGIVVVDAMPMQSCTPQQIADILLQPTHDEISSMKADLVAGDITFEQWKQQMGILKFRLEVQLVLLEAIRDSPIMSYEQKLEALFAIFPWNVRGSMNA